MPTTADPNVYLRTKVLTASPEELRLMLLDGAIKFLTQGRDALLGKDFEGWYTGLTKCRNIIVELLTSVRPEGDPELYRRVTGLYTFMYSRLIDANLDRDPVKADEVISLLAFERETWELVMKKVTSDRGTVHADDAAREDVARETASAATIATVPAYRPLSVQG